MEVMRTKSQLWLLATNGGDEDQILIQLPPPAVTTNGWVKAIIVADTSIGIMGLTSVESMLLGIDNWPNKMKSIVATTASKKQCSHLSHLNR